MDKNYINSKIECPICKRDFAKNYILVHLQKQHNNIYNTPAWEGSRYEENFIKIKKDHKLKWDKE